MGIPFLVTDDSAFGFLALGERPRGVIAIGTEPVGIIAIGEMATGLVAVACGVARGVVAVSCGVAVGGVVCVCGVGAGFWTAAIGLGLSVRENVGMALSSWPGEFPRARPSGETVPLEQVQKTGERGWVHGRLVSERSLVVGDRMLDVSFDDAASAEEYVGHDVHAQLDLAPAAGTGRGYRDAPDHVLVVRALRDAYLPPFSRGEWFLRAAASVLLGTAVLAACTWGILWS